MEYRNLDGIYFRVKRYNKWRNICFSDLTADEMEQILKDKDQMFLKTMCKVLGETIRNIGDYFDISKKR